SSAILTLSVPARATTTRVYGARPATNDHGAGAGGGQGLREVTPAEPGAGHEAHRGADHWPAPGQRRDQDILAEAARRGQRLITAAAAQAGRGYRSGGCVPDSPRQKHHDDHE